KSLRSLYEFQVICRNSLKSLDRFNYFKNLVLNFHRLEQEKIFKVVFISNYLSDFFHCHKGYFKVTIFKISKTMFLAGDFECGTALENSLFFKHKPSIINHQKEIKLNEFQLSVL